jgi:hypothetical protein
MLRRFLSAFIPGVVLFLMGGAGCIIIGSGNSSAPKGPPGGPGAVARAGVDVCAVDPREYTVTIDEVNAVMQLSFDAMKVDHLKKIAARPSLTPAEQEYVACNALHRISFDAMKVDVLMTLIDNPAFSYRAKGKILRHLNAISFDAMRADIIHAMEGKGDQPASAAAPPAPAAEPAKEKASAEHEDK